MGLVDEVREALPGVPEEQIADTVKTLVALRHGVLDGWGYGELIELADMVAIGEEDDEA